MMLTVLTVAGVVGALLAAYVLSAKPQVAQAPTGFTLVANTRPDLEMLPLVCQDQPVPRNEWCMISVHTLNDAEQLLDLLENQGFTERELMVKGHSQFAIRWK